MPTNLSISLAGLEAFLLVLARVGGAIVLVPLPGLRQAPQTARAVLAVACTLALQSRWPAAPAADLTPFRLAGWVMAEASVGLAIGLAVAMTLEVFALAAQILGLQAGYAYASTIDPNSEADSGVLLVFAQLMAGMLFFSAGLDRQVLRLFAQTLEHIPAGQYTLNTASAEPLIGLGASLISFGLRLALPVVALLVMVDVALALMGRLNAQLQLLSLAFPAKMLLALLILSWGAVLFPRILGAFSTEAWTALHRMWGF